ncbi:MAG TPA: hypothetical protein VKB80_29775 [Kofleriaceae bacterium]|nr:hypothetical protein [Kofleriaceae bacterium]
MTPTTRTRSPDPARRSAAGAPAAIRVKTQIRAGGQRLQHNETLVRVHLTRR